MIEDRKTKEKDFEEKRRVNYLDCESFQGKPISAGTIGEIMYNEGIILDLDAVQRIIRKKYSSY